MDMPYALPAEHGSQKSLHLVGSYSTKNCLCLDYFYFKQNYHEINKQQQNTDISTGYQGEEEFSSHKLLQ